MLGSEKRAMRSLSNHNRAEHETTITWQPNRFLSSILPLSSSTSTSSTQPTSIEKSLESDKENGRPGYKQQHTAQAAAQMSDSSIPAEIRQQMVTNGVGFYGMMRRRSATASSNWDCVLLDDAAIDIGLSGSNDLGSRESAKRERRDTGEDDEMVRIMGEYCLWNKRRSVVDQTTSTPSAPPLSMAVTATSPGRVRRREEGGAMGDVVGQCHDLLFEEDYIR
ncbi:hypothetical protein BZA70DRAFT_132098 [Myxozyma melibiosi]|uniref:Uncharacterized protein n=1 Tax=Myxozyma melibiosi TaxID=54550 RepID=A0ABR1F930_9ASCO